MRSRVTLAALLAALLLFLLPIPAPASPCDIAMRNALAAGFDELQAVDLLVRCETKRSARADARAALLQLPAARATGALNSHHSTPLHATPGSHAAAPDLSCNLSKSAEKGGKVLRPAWCPGEDLNLARAVGKPVKYPPLAGAP